jgi:two-component system, NtrC family, sensor histidine kinase PilS
VTKVTYPGEIREWVVWFLKLRVVVYTVILGILVGVEKVVSPAVPYSAVLSVLLTALVLTLIFSLWAMFASNYRLQSIIQISIDLGIITAIVYLTGATESFFWILYFLIIVYASLVFFQRGGIITAAAAALLHSSMLLVVAAQVIPSYALVQPPLRSVLVLIALNSFALLVVGYFSGYLSENLRRKGVELQDKTNTLATVMALNENIFQSMRGGLLTTDLEAKVTRLNPAGEEILRRGGTDIIGKLIGEAFPDIHFADCTSMLSSGVRNVRIDSILSFADGSEKFVGLSVSPLYRDHQVLIGYLVNFQDLTELKRLEREIRAKDRMAAVGEMAAGMAHEIRNPLASMSGSVGLLRRELSLTEDQSKLMKIVFYEAQRLNKIINDFLIYSRQVTHNPQPVDLNQLMEDTITLLDNSSEVTEKHRIEGKSEQNPLLCTADPDLLRQVFWNLSQNAVRAMPQGGTLTIEIKKPDHGEVKIFFRDTGVGIEEDRIDKIFEPFHSSFADGTGLGLAIVYQIIQVHQGRIEAHSTLGQGAVFEVTLPCGASTS